MSKKFILIGEKTISSFLLHDNYTWGSI